MKYYIGIDLGGTNIVAGVVDENYNIVSKASTKTNLPRPEKEIAADMAKVSVEAVKEAGLKMDDIEWVGIGTPGIANSEKGIIEYSCNLGFNNTPMVDYIKEYIDKPVFIENDANAAAYGEYVAGAAKGAKNAVCITLGTGVGGGIIIDGKIYSGSNFAGAEIGHTVIEVDGPQCTCGRKGCFEVFSSATGLIRMTKEAMAKDSESVMQLKGESVESVIHSLLSSPSNFTPLLHFIIPVNDGTNMAFGEMWINPDEEEPKPKVKNNKEKSDTDDYQRTIHMLLVFDIPDIGRFETELYVRDKKIDMSLMCPASVENFMENISGDLKKCIGFSQYSFNNIKIGKLEKTRSLVEVFPTLPRKRTGINVRI